MKQDSGFLIDKNTYFVICLFILCIATACRIYSIDASSLWADELWGVDACSQGSWWAMINNLIYTDSHPPGYQTLLYYWMLLFGQSDFMVRLPSVVAGIAAVAAVYRLGRVFLSPVTGLLAAAILAVSYNAIYYSQEARAYIFLMLFATLHYHVFLQLFLRKEQKTSHWVSFWILGVLLAYFHYVGVVIVLSEAAVMLFLISSGDRRSQFFKAFVPIFLLYVPWLPVLYRHLFFDNPSWETTVPVIDDLVKTVRFVLGPDSVRFYTGIALTLIFLFSCIAKLKNNTLAESQRVLLLLLLLSLIPLLAFYIKSHLGASAYTIRHFTYLIPVFALVCAWSMNLLLGWQNWQQAGAVWFLVSGIALISIMLNVSNYFKVGARLYNISSKIEYRQAVETIMLDKIFMQNKPRHVFISNNFFDHYLKFLDVKEGSTELFYQDTPERFPEYEKLIREKVAADFYYLEVFQDVSTGGPSPVLQYLYSRYYTVCVKQFVWVQVVKFSTRLPPEQNQVVWSCPRATPVAAPVQS